jgi:anti-sigma factor RsiW
MAAPALRSKVTGVGFEQTRQGARRALCLRLLVRLERSAFLEARFAQSARVLALLMLRRQLAAALARCGGRKAEAARFELLRRRTGIERPDGLAVCASFILFSSVDRSQLGANVDLAQV